MIKWVIATVTTNCEKDDYYRVKVKSPRIWEESELMPSIGGIYLDVGDIVMVDISDGVDNAFIVRKLRYKEQNDLSNVDDDHSPIIAEASDRDGSGAWMYIRVSDGGNKVHFKNWKDQEITCEGDNIDIVIPNNRTEEVGNDLSVKSGNNYDIEAGGKVTITAPVCEIKAKTIIKRSLGTPDGGGPLCALPACVFSGAVHVSSQSS